MTEYALSSDNETPEINLRQFPAGEVTSLSRGEVRTVSLKPEDSLGQVTIHGEPGKSDEVTLHALVSDDVEEGTQMMLVSKPGKDRKGKLATSVYAVRTRQLENGAWEIIGASKAVPNKYRSSSGHKTGVEADDSHSRTIGTSFKRSGDRVMVASRRPVEVVATSEKRRHKILKVGKEAVEMAGRVHRKVEGTGLILAFAGVAILAPGKGVADRVTDPFIDGGEVTSGLIAEQQAESGYTQGDMIWEYLHMEGDLGHFEDIPALERFKSYSPQELEASMEEIMEVADKAGEPIVRDILEADTKDYSDKAESVERVARIFKDLDSNDPSTIVERAAAIIEDNPDQYISQLEIDSVLEAIDNAETPEELERAIKATLNFYGKEFDASDVGDDMANARGMSKAIIKVVSSLPKDLVASDMPFSKFILGDPAGHGIISSPFSHIGGLNNGRSIVLNVHASQFKQANIWLHSYDTASTRDQLTVAHEMEHSLNEDYLPMPPKDATSSAWDAGRHIASHLFGSPSQPSLYSIISESEHNFMDGDEEFSAEAVGGLISGEMPHPDKIRQFNSELSGKRLAVLAEIEQKYPGAADVLMARNGTIEKTATETGQDILQYTLLIFMLVKGAEGTRTGKRVKNRAQKAREELRSRKK